MELKELKERVNKHQYVSLPLVFVGKNSDFLKTEYISAIAKNLGARIVQVESLQELVVIDQSLFELSNNLYVYNLKSDESVPKGKLLQPNIIYTSDTKKDKDIDVEFPEPTNWQIEDYVATMCKGLERDKVVWLCKQADYDIIKLNKECEKLSLFNEKDQREIFALSQRESVYNRLKTPKIFNLTNAIMKRSVAEVKEYLENYNSNIEPMLVVNLLLSSFRCLLDIYYNPKTCVESSGAKNEKQYSMIKYNKNYFTKEEVLKNYKFLLGIDYRMKMGLLDTTDKNVCLYIVSHILERV